MRIVPLHLLGTIAINESWSVEEAGAETPLRICDNLGLGDLTVTGNCFDGEVMAVAALEIIGRDYLSQLSATGIEKWQCVGRYICLATKARCFDQTIVLWQITDRCGYACFVLRCHSEVLPRIIEEYQDIVESFVFQDPQQ